MFWADCWSLIRSKLYLTCINITLCVSSTEHPWSDLSVIHTRAIAFLCANQGHLSFFQCIRNMNCTEQNKLIFVYLLQSTCLPVDLLLSYIYLSKIVNIFALNVLLNTFPYISLIHWVYILYSVRILLPSSGCVYPQPEIQHGVPPGSSWLYCGRHTGLMVSVFKSNMHSLILAPFIQLNT